LANVTVTNGNVKPVNKCRIYSRFAASKQTKYKINIYITHIYYLPLTKKKIKKIIAIYGQCK
jgi:hypothetical protein